ncbi:MAG: hypothetical protein FJY07_11640 [Bacteroidetes bacterium]|nr:hypothetical protein [Bacteroidota bacterium]
METKITTDHFELVNDIRSSLANAEKNAIKIRKFNAWLLIISIVTSAATTLVTAITAARGPIVGEGPSGWKVSCLIAAAFGFATTVCVGANQGFRFSDRGSRANECAGRLRSLDISIKTGTKNWDLITKEYEEIVSKFPEEIR